MVKKASVPLMRILRACPVCVENGELVECAALPGDVWECPRCGGLWGSTKEYMRAKNGMGTFKKINKILEVLENA